MVLWDKWTVKDIARRLEEGPLSSRELKELRRDSRKGVLQLLERYERRQMQQEKEMRRLRRLLRLEKALQKNGFTIVAGVDEAGRGPLAGPVIAAAVILPFDFVPQGLKDSKQLSPQRREQIFREIQAHASAVAWAAAEVEEIDRFNIHRASLLAMKRAVDKLEREADFLLVDGFPMEDIAIPQRPVKSGDARCASIAAASVVAKVIRDGIMQELHECYPCYGFDRHKGYGTGEHREALSRYGPAPPHRRTFIHNNPALYRE